MKFSELYIALGFKDDRFKRGIKSAQTRTKAFGNVIKSIGPMIAGAFAVTAITSFVKGIFRLNIAFEKAMSGVKAITGATNEEFKLLTDSAKDLAKVTTKTALEVAALQKEFALIGFSTKEIIDSTAATIQLAEATGEDLATSAQIAGASLRGFGIEAKNSQRVIDIMASSFTSSALNLDRWGESMKYVAPVARAANVSIEETAAMMSILADAGIHGSMAGTALRMMMLKLTKGGEPLSEKLRELAARGITLADANDEVGMRAQTALLVLSKQTDVISKLTGQYENATGAAKEMARIQTDNVAGSLDRLKSAWQDQMLQMDKGNGIVQGTVEILTTLTSKLSDISNFVATGFWGKLFDIKLIGGANDAIEDVSDEVDSVMNKTAGVVQAWEKMRLLSAEIATKQSSTNNKVEEQLRLERDKWYIIDQIDNSLQSQLDKQNQLAAAQAEIFSHEEETENTFNYLKGDELDNFFSGLDDKESKYKKFGDTMGAVNESIASSAIIVSNVLSQQAGGWVSFVGTMGVQILRLIAMYQAQALAASAAGAATSGTATGPAAIITTPAFMAAAIAGVLGVFAAIPKFADGGIIPGLSNYGDGVLGRFNSGEMVLNQGQQSNLFKMLDSGGNMNLSGQFVAKGSDLIAVIDRTNKVRGVTR